MPNWNGVLDDLEGHSETKYDLTRRKYLKQLERYTGRNVLVYYSGWLQKPNIRGVDFGISDADKTGFMTCSHKLDRAKGIDLVLHTPGGSVGATESIIEYLQSLYDGNMRAIVPQIAMSGGTLIAMACCSIVMGRQSSLGPVDPQINGMPAEGIIEEFDQAAVEIKKDRTKAALWQPIIAKYWPTLITSCQHAIRWSDELMVEYLGRRMLRGDPPDVRAKKIQRIGEMFGKQVASKSHSRHIGPETAANLGLQVEPLEDDQDLQDKVLSLHHALTITLAQTNVVKLIENHKGVRYVTGASLVSAS